MRVSLHVKIMGLILALCMVLLGIFLLLLFLQNQHAQQGRNHLLRQADSIALQGSINAQKEILEKVALDILNIDEVVTFLADPHDDEAKMVVQGFFLSFAELGVVRMTFYAPSGQILLEQARDRTLRSSPLPASLQGLYAKAAEDLDFHFYFRGIEKQNTPSFPVEYCVVNVITDDDDNTVGFVEIALDAQKWVDSLVALTENMVSLWSPVVQQFTLSTDPGITEKKNFVPTDLEETEFTLVKIGEKWIETDIIPLLGKGNTAVSYLFLSRDSTAQVEKQRRYSFIIFLAIGLVLIVGLLLIFLLVRRGIVLPLRKVTDFAIELAAGHFTHSLEIRTNDEIDEMARALNTMAASVRKRAEEAEAIATGDLTVAVVVPSSEDVLGRSLEKIVSHLSHLVQQISSRAEELGRSSVEVRGFTERIKQSSESIILRSSSISEVSESITQDVEKIASATKEMSDSMDSISQSTLQDKAISEEAMAFSERAEETIEKLNSSAAQIEQASLAINDFADQTNLLSLNATIEAARAGDAGKGFAVVASEVKELANRSMETARSISGDVDTIQKFTAEVNRQTHDVTASIRQLNEASLTTVSTLTEQASLAGDLSQTIGTAYSQVKSLTDDLEAIREVITRNDRIIVSLADSSQLMAELAQGLNDLVSQFRLSS